SRRLCSPPPLVTRMMQRCWSLPTVSRFRPHPRSPSDSHTARADIMNFFEHQDTARRNTRRLVILMLLAVISLIAITTVLVAVLLYHYEYARGAAPGASAESNVIVLSFQTLSWEILAYITLVIGAVVALGSTYKLLQLS